MRWLDKRMNEWMIINSPKERDRKKIRFFYFFSHHITTSDHFDHRWWVMIIIDIRLHDFDAFGNIWLLMIFFSFWPKRVFFFGDGGNDDGQSLPIIIICSFHLNKMNWINELTYRHTDQKKIVANQSASDFLLISVDIFSID